MCDVKSKSSNFSKSQWCLTVSSALLQQSAYKNTYINITFVHINRVKCTHYKLLFSLHRNQYTCSCLVAFKDHDALLLCLYVVVFQTYRSVQSSSVQSFSRVRLFATPWIAARQASLTITNSRSLLKPMPIGRWCHPAISCSVVPFSSCPQSLPASGSFPESQLFSWGGQSIGVSASASVLPMNTQDWSPLGWTGWISLQSKGLSGVFSNTVVQKHQFFSTQLSSQSNSHIHTWPLDKP